MDIPAKITVPEYIYRFYADASRCIHGSTAEDVMADALTAYAGMLSRDIARQNKPSEPEENP